MHFSKKAWISGLVQGVNFRTSAQKEARSLDLVGWVRNLSDGRVETYYCGSEDSIKVFESWLSEGPRGGRVDKLEISPVEWQFYEDFIIRR